MQLKLDDNGNAVIDDGKPVYVREDGTEVAFDVAGTTATIQRLNQENQKRREANNELTTKLSAFEGIEDPQAALQALEQIAKLDSKKLIDAGEVDKVKAEISKAFQAQLDEAQTKAQQAETRLRDSLLGGAFARSKFITEKLVLPADIAQSYFGQHFSVGDDGKVVGKFQSGDTIYSAANPGEVATFDEALQILVDQYPAKDTILRSNGASGSGAGSSSAGNAGAKSMARSAFDKLSPTERMTAMTKGVQITEG